MTINQWIANNHARIFRGVLVTFLLSLAFIQSALAAADSATPPDLLDALDSRISKNFEVQWRTVERNAGTSSSLRFYKVKVPTRDEGVMINAALDWIEDHAWDVRSTTATLVRKVVERNPELFKSLERGAALDAPLWPSGFDFNTPVPNVLSVMAVSRLMLFRARMAAETNITSAVQDAMVVMRFGRHFRHPHACGPSIGEGDCARGAAIGFLDWLVEHQPRPLPNAGDLARRLERERTRCAPLNELYRQILADSRKSTIAEYEAVRREAPVNPHLMAQVRGILAKQAGVNVTPMTNTQVLDLLSTASISRRYAEITSLTRAFAGLSPARRIRRSDLADRLKTIPGLGVATLKCLRKESFWVTEMMPELFLRADKTEGALRRLITALACQQASLDGQHPEPLEALSRLGISAEVGIDPFSEKPFRCRVTAPGRAVMEFGGLDVLRDLGFDPKPLDFPIHPDPSNSPETLPHS